MRKRVSQNSGELWLNLEQVQREEIKGKLPELVLADPKCVIVHNPSICYLTHEITQ